MSRPRLAHQLRAICVVVILGASAHGIPGFAQDKEQQHPLPGITLARWGQDDSGTLKSSAVGIKARVVGEARWEVFDYLYPGGILGQSVQFSEPGKLGHVWMNYSKSFSDGGRTVADIGGTYLCIPDEHNWDWLTVRGFLADIESPLARHIENMKIVGPHQRTMSYTLPFSDVTVLLEGRDTRIVGGLVTLDPSRTQVLEFNLRLGVGEEERHTWVHWEHTSVQFPPRVPTRVRAILQNASLFAALRKVVATRKLSRKPVVERPCDLLGVPLNDELSDRTPWSVRSPIYEYLLARKGEAYLAVRLLYADSHTASYGWRRWNQRTGAWEESADGDLIATVDLSEGSTSWPAQDPESPGSPCPSTWLAIPGMQIGRDLYGFLHFMGRKEDVLGGRWFEFARTGSWDLGAVDPTDSKIPWLRAKR